MTLDSTSWTDLYEYARARGFSGTFDDWFSEMRRQEAASAVRDFARYAMAVCLDKSLEPVFLAGCHCALPKFKHVFNNCGAMTANINFARRVEDSGRGVRINELDVSVRSIKGRAYVQVRGYVGGNLRLDRIFVAAQGEQA